jgi:Ala-tRNA(Pro) deacylase
MTGAQMASTGVRALSEYLDGEGIAHELIEHEPTMSAAAEARTLRFLPQRVAKTVVLHDGSASVLAVVPASHRLDLRKLRNVLGATRRLRLATEREVAREFPTIEVGAMPPVGPTLPAAEVIDRRLLEHDRVLCAGGDPRHSLGIDSRDLLRAADAIAADICED